MYENLAMPTSPKGLSAEVASPRVELVALTEELQKERGYNRELIEQIVERVGNLSMFPPESGDEQRPVPPVNDFRSALYKEVILLSDNNVRLRNILNHLRTII